MFANKKKLNNSVYVPADTDGYEFLIVSLDNKQWQFEANSSEDRDEWVAAIEQQILNSLQVSVHICIIYGQCILKLFLLISILKTYFRRATRSTKWTSAANSDRPITERKTCRASGRGFLETDSAPTAIPRIPIGPVWIWAYSCASSVPAYTGTWARTFPKSGRSTWTDGRECSIELYMNIFIWFSDLTKFGTPDKCQQWRV